VVQDKSPPESPFRPAYRYDRIEGNDDDSQPRALFRLFNTDQKQKTFSNIADPVNGVPQYLLEHQLGHFDKVDPEYGGGVRAALVAAGHPLEEPAGGD
jgi:catalase